MLCMGTQNLQLLAQNLGYLRNKIEELEEVKLSWAYVPAWEMAEAIRKKQVSPVEIVEELLSRIERLNSKFNAYLTVTDDEARSAARKAEAAVMRGEELPPLHGVPISVKDLLATCGIRTTLGSAIFKNHIPQADSIAVERVKKAGAIIFGKTNTPEFGLQGIATQNRLGDDCRNPWNPAKASGGSSGGAAVSIATGLGPIAIGTDGGGSIRLPASFCGIYGLKPTYGRVPKQTGNGGNPAFSVIGPMARNVRDAALLFGVIAGFDRRDPSCLRIKPPDLTQSVACIDRLSFRIAWSPDLGYANVDREIAAATESAACSFEDFGCRVEFSSPKIEPCRVRLIYQTIVFSNTYSAYGYLLKTHRDLLMPYARERLEMGSKITDKEYSEALGILDELRAIMKDYFEQYDLLMTPTTAIPAIDMTNPPKEINGKTLSGEGGSPSSNFFNFYWHYIPFCRVFNYVGYPAASIPCGFTTEGLPIGLQIVGRFGDEESIVRASAAFEQARPWKDFIPPGCD